VTAPRKSRVHSSSVKLDAAALQSDVHRVVPGDAILLVGTGILLVHNDDAEARERREDGAA